MARSWRRLLLVVALCTGCSDQSKGDPDAGATPMGASGEAGASAGSSGGSGTGASGSGGSGSQLPGTSADAGAAGGGSSPQDAGPSGDAGSGSGADSGTAVVAPKPVEPCGDDLDAQQGQVAPDFGTAPPATTFTGDLDDLGPFAVFEADVTIENPDSARPSLDATFYAPSEDAGASVAQGARPLVLLMHGFGTTHRNYLHFSRHLASHGFVVLGLTLPFTLTAAHDKNAAEAIAAIDYALSDSAPAALAGRVDPERIAAAGHSFGGKIAFYAAALDARIDLVIGWDPSNAGGPPCFVDAMACNQFPVAPNCLADDSGIVHQLHAESVIFRAAPDGANPEPAHNAQWFYRGAPAPATLLDFGANVLHGDFANPAAAVLPHTRRVQLAFLLTRLAGVRGLEPYLPGGDAIDEDPLLERVLSR